jgi:predicted nuclease of predicted toxin-antitoxin system
MTLQLYMDVHVPWAITTALRRRGVDVLRSQDDGTTTMDDPDLLDRATALGRVLFTRDEDLLREGGLRQQNGVPFAGVIYAHQVRVPAGRCIDDLELIAKVYAPTDVAGTVTYLPL